MFFRVFGGFEGFFQRVLGFLGGFCEFLDGFAGVFPRVLWIFGRLCGFPGGFVVFSVVLWVFWWF